ncbi:MAG: hypothetical protein NUV42_01750 [Candidatus Yonathbacteria bacterium]|nr:hypothetical protein [Candidatus Yonathbacteria bacterium]
MLSQRTIIIFVLAILLIGGGLYIAQQKKEPTPTDTTPTTEQAITTVAQTIEELAAEHGIPIVDKGELPESTIDTSDWQTYRNEEFGFEVRYPYSTGSVNTEAGVDEKGVWFFEEEKREKGIFVTFSNTPHDFLIGVDVYPSSVSYFKLDFENAEFRERFVGIEKYRHPKYDIDMYKIISRNPHVEDREYRYYSIFFDYKNNSYAYVVGAEEGVVDDEMIVSLILY